MKDIKVFKVGGSVLNNHQAFLSIAKKVSRHTDSGICIVTSAMKGKTDQLANTFLDTVPEPDFFNFERFVSMGEIHSAILFESAFKHIGSKAIAVLPWMKEWPLYISLKNKNPVSRKKINEKRDFSLLNKSKDKTRKYLLPLFRKKKTVIIPGFVAKDGRGRVVTLGRGGSDISALLIGELLGGEELILIKDVEGILSVDPNVQKKFKKIKSLNSDELGVVAASGAQVLNPVSLKHREKLKRIKVVSIDSPTLDSGTEVSFSKQISVKASKTSFSVLTFLGSKIPETAGILFEISSILSREDISINSITISDNLVAIYVDNQKADLAYRKLSPLLEKLNSLKVLNLKRNIGKVVVRSLKFINEPGVIKRIVTPVSKEGINIWEVLTVHTDVMVFVEKKDLKRTLQIIMKIFKGGK